MNRFVRIVFRDGFAKHVAEGHAEPFTSAPKRLATSRMMDAMKYESSKRIGSEQIWPAKRIQRNSCCQCLNDLLRESPVFDEDLAGVPASDNHACKMMPGTLLSSVFDPAPVCGFPDRASRQGSG